MKKTNNKGFSLVELIVVIAIMAVLVGVLAPQFLKYVERSRESTDVQNAQAVITAIQTAAADETLGVDDGTVAFTGTKQTAAAAASTDKLDAALASAGITSIQSKSTKYATFTITVTITDGVPSFTTNVTDLSTQLGL